MSLDRERWLWKWPAAVTGQPRSQQAGHPEDDLGHSFCHPGSLTTQRCPNGPSPHTADRRHRQRAYSCPLRQPGSAVNSRPCRGSAVASLRARDRKRAADHPSLARPWPFEQPFLTERLRPLANFWAAHGFVMIQPTHLDSETLSLNPDGPTAPRWSPTSATGAATHPGQVASSSWEPPWTDSGCASRSSRRRSIMWG